MSTDPTPEIVSLPVPVKVTSTVLPPVFMSVVLAELRDPPMDNVWAAEPELATFRVPEFATLPVADTLRAFVLPNDKVFVAAIVIPPEIVKSPFVASLIAAVVVFPAVTEKSLWIVKSTLASVLVQAHPAVVLVMVRLK